ncbi:MAG: hypothetical protein LBD79_03340 [Treponema sp.]|nr:hypothetical protein [Treponema sp.]
MTVTHYPPGMSKWNKIKRRRIVRCGVLDVPLSRNDYKKSL